MAATYTLKATAEERDLLWRRYTNHRTVENRNALIDANQRLIYPVVRAFRRAVKNDDDFYDIEQAAMMGLIRAVELFDPDKGFQFSTYATHWVYQSVERHVRNTGLLIRIPVHVHDIASSFRRAEQIFAKTYGKPPANDHELAEFLGYEPEMVSSIREQCHPRSVVSLDLPISGKEGEDTLLEDFLVGDLDENPLAQLLKKQPREDIDIEAFKEALGTLDDRSRTMLWLSANDITLEEIGQKFTITRERVRQIIAKAIVKVREFLGVDPTIPIRSIRLYGNTPKPPDEEKEAKETLSGFQKRVKKLGDFVEGASTYDPRKRIQRRVRSTKQDPSVPRIARRPQDRREQLPVIGRGKSTVGKQPAGRPGRAKPGSVIPTPCVPVRPRISISEEELLIAQLIFPKLSTEDDRYVDLDMIAQTVELPKNKVYLRTASLIAKGILSQEEPGLYRQGTPYVSVVTGKGKEKESRDVNLNGESLETILGVVESVQGNDLLQEIQIEAPAGGDINQEIIRLQKIRAEVNRRLDILREAKAILTTPLPDFQE